MHSSNTNNHLFLKVFLLFLIVFIFSASNDFKKRSNNKANHEIGLCVELKQQTRAVLVLLPELPTVKTSYSFGKENNFLFRNLKLAQETYTAQNERNKFKLLTVKHLDLKKKFKTQAFFTTFQQSNNIPDYYLA